MCDIQNRGERVGLKEETETRKIGQAAFTLNTLSYLGLRPAPGRAGGGDGWQCAGFQGPGGKWGRDRRPPPSSQQPSLLGAPLGMQILPDLLNQESWGCPPPSVLTSLPGYSDLQGSLRSIKLGSHKRETAGGRDGQQDPDGCSNAILCLTDIESSVFLKVR